VRSSEGLFIFTAYPSDQTAARQARHRYHATGENQMTPTPDQALLNQVLAIAREAGDAIMAVYSREFDVEFKDDKSPLTEADRAADQVIRRGLDSVRPPIPVLTEEIYDPADADRLNWPAYWLVDPLDGTREFIKRNGEFTVNIAMIAGHEAVLGVVVAPALDVAYFGARGVGAFRQHGHNPPTPIEVHRDAADPVRIVGSRSHPGPELAAYLERLGDCELVPMGSSLKICLVAEGRADLYPRLGPTSEWDTAAAQAVLESAGGVMMDRAGRPLRYNTGRDILNPHFFAYGDRTRDWLAPIRN
jgi:3'(2'), 5'-bisphosphate nucleotidase